MARQAEPRGQGDERNRRARNAGGEGPSSSALPPHLEEQRTRVLCDMDAPKNTSSVQYGGAYSSLGPRTSAATQWDLESFRRSFSVAINRLESESEAAGREVEERCRGFLEFDRENSLSFDLVGLDPAIANAFRRILLAEVPSMAIERVFVANNTSLLQDEVLAHRLGLVPLRADPRHFEYLAPDGLANENNTLVFKLDHTCKRVGATIQGAKVLSSMLQWMPQGSEYPPDQPSKKFTTFSRSQKELPHLAAEPPAPVHPDIVLDKLRPGQAIELEAHAVKGIGKVHAKWSPVATATYRMLPEVRFKLPVEGVLAEELVGKCPVNVFDIEDIAGTKTAVAARPRDCTLCRECVRGEEWAERVELTRVKNHFIFNIESTGCLPPGTLFTEAVNILKGKASRILSEIS